MIFGFEDFLVFGLLIGIIMVLYALIGREIVKQPDDRDMNQDEQKKQ